MVMQNNALTYASINSQYASNMHAYKQLVSENRSLK